MSTDVSDLPLRVVLILLAFASGLIDAASYLGLGHVFTANMTGNVLLLGFATAGASGFSTSACLASVGAFLVGAGVAGRLDREEILGALATLSTVQREALELGYFSGLTQQEIAFRTNTPLGTVKSRMRLGLLQMRRAMIGTPPGSGEPA